jgi:ribosomal protein S18 acetylase RimI-like enzyme
MDHITIREATEQDLPAIKGLMAELIEAVSNTGSYDANTALQNCRVLLKNADSHILVAEADGNVIGVVNLDIRRTILHPGLSGLIDEIVVAEGYRGKGVGKKLIDAAVEKCKLSGCCEIEVSTELTNTKARSFYKSCGFEEMGVFLERDI